jgi:hypothetical protein
MQRSSPEVPQTEIAPASTSASCSATCDCEGTQIS